MSKTVSYVFVFVPAKEGGYVVFSPDFPEIKSQGEDIDECIYMATDALQMVVDHYKYHNKELPVACDSDQAVKRIRNELAQLDCELPINISLRSISIEV